MDAAEFRKKIHAEASKKVRTRFPEAVEILNRYPAESYLRKIWDYPGAWYTIPAIPEGIEIGMPLLKRFSKYRLSAEQGGNRSPLRIPARMLSPHCRTLFPVFPHGCYLLPRQKRNASIPWRQTFQCLRGYYFLCGFLLSAQEAIPAMHALKDFKAVFREIANVIDIVTAASRACDTFVFR